MKLINFADWVNGHYCIGRQIGKSIYWEYWAEHLNGWAAFGTLYLSRKEALKKLKELKKCLI